MTVKTKTQYIAPVSLWLVARRRMLETGLFIEPAWVGDGTQNGPAIFVSRILAESYAHLRNKYHGDDDSNNWKVIGLHEFDLLEHAHGIDGPLYCQMTFGFSNEDAERLICITAPRIRYVPLPFRISKDAEGVTFSFNQWAFDFMREQWTGLGLPEFEQELEATDEMDDASFDKLLKTAIARLDVCREPSGKDGPWSVFSIKRDEWVAGFEAPADVDRTMH